MRASHQPTVKSSTARIPLWMILMEIEGAGLSGILNSTGSSFNTKGAFSQTVRRIFLPCSQMRGQSLCYSDGQLRFGSCGSGSPQQVGLGQGAPSSRASGRVRLWAEPLLGSFALSLHEAFLLFYAVLCDVKPKVSAAPNFGSAPSKTHSKLFPTDLYPSESATALIFWLGGRSDSTGGYKHSPRFWLACRTYPRFPSALDSGTGF